MLKHFAYLENESKSDSHDEGVGSTDFIHWLN